MAGLARSIMEPDQVKVAEFIREHLNCYISMEIGLGKTAAALTAFSDLKKALDPHRPRQPFKMLVIAPLRIARKVWKDEIAAWSHLNHLKLVPIVGSAAQRITALGTDADIHTINVENIAWLESQFLSATRKQIRDWPWQMVVLDESQYFKSASAKRFKSLRRLRKFFARCVALTGTPIPNGYEDLWSQYHLLDQGARLGRTMTAFRDRWYDQLHLPTHTEYKIKPHAAKEIQGLIADITLTVLDTKGNKPKVSEIRVTLPPKARKLYDRLEHESIVDTYFGHKVTAVNQAATHGKLIQLANGAVYVDENTYETLHDEKIDALKELLDTLGGKALIAYSYRHDLARLEEALTGRNYSTLDNDAIQDSWNRGEIDYLLIHPKSCGPGLNLQFSGAEHVIWFGLTANRGHYDQLNGRLGGGLRRAGRNVIIHHIMADDTVDEVLLGWLRRKGATQDDLKTALSSRIL